MKFSRMIKMLRTMYVKCVCMCICLYVVCMFMFRLPVTVSDLNSLRDTLNEYSVCCDNDE